MKTFFTALFVVCLIFFAQAQEQENPIRLKQINVVITKFRNLKSGESINKTYEFSEGKLRTIQTSDVTQSFFYNPKSTLPPLKHMKLHIFFMYFNSIQTMNYRNLYTFQLRNIWLSLKCNAKKVSIKRLVYQ